MPIVRFRRREGDFFAVARFEIATVWDESDAVEWAEAIAESPDFAQFVERGMTRAQLEALAAQILRGDVLIVRLPPPARLMDDPAEIPDLADLAGEATEETLPHKTESWVAVHVVDQRGRPLPFFRARVLDPTGAEHEAKLDQNAAAHFPKLTDDGPCTVRLEVDPEHVP